MAVSKKSTTNTNKSTASVEEAIPPNSSNVLEQENEMLKKQMEAMQAQMELLAKQVAMSATMVEPVKKVERNIEFINLVPGTLVLKGHQIWKIEGQFNSRTFIESEARIIVNNMQELIRSGCVYIADYDFIKDNELENAYNSMLSDEQLKHLLDNKFNEVVEIYKTVPKAQQDIIVRMIQDKKESGVSIDANILIQIGKLCGKDLISEVEYEDEG